jgi:hypothetical protein
VKALFLSVLLLAFAQLVVAAKPDGVPRATVAELEKQLESTIIDKVDYHEATIVEIADDLVARSKKLDPNKKGFTISFTPAARKAPQRITLRLTNVPMIELIKYVTNLADLQYRLAKNHVIAFDVLQR